VECMAGGQGEVICVVCSACLVCEDDPVVFVLCLHMKLQVYFAPSSYVS